MYEYIKFNKNMISIVKHEIIELLSELPNEDKCSLFKSTYSKLCSAIYHDASINDEKVKQAQLYEAKEVIKAVIGIKEPIQKDSPKKLPVKGISIPNPPSVASPPISIKKEGVLPIFHLPVPMASARDDITDIVNGQIKKSNILLKDIDSILTRALDSCGYFEKSYYGVHNGFALVTLMEKIYEDGRSAPNSIRWIHDNRPAIEFTMVGLMKMLFTANPGYFRTIVFPNWWGVFTSLYCKFTCYRFNTRYSVHL
jgi:hypothetical protein